MMSCQKDALGFGFSSAIMLDWSEPCRGQFLIFEKKSSIFSFARQKANSLTFCAKIRSDHRIWSKYYWNHVEWTQEMVFNTYHHIRTHLDKKIEIVEKNFKIIFSLPISLRATLKRSLRSWFLAKNNFSFFIEISVLTLKYHQTSIPSWKNT